MALKTSWYTSSPDLAKSNYQANVDPSHCVACGGCVEVCPQNAVKLGEKLCQKQPVEVKSAKVASDYVFMPPKKWTGEAFLTNRDNVVPETGTAPCKSNCPAHIAVQGAERGDAIHPEEAVQRGKEDSRHRLRPRGTLRCLLPRRLGSRRHGV